MKTTSISVSTLCVPCANRCRYCLLSWDGRLLGADYDRCQKYAEGFYVWIREHRPQLSFQFYYGYAMEHPRLGEAIDFARKIGSAGGEFLQLDGLQFRSETELQGWLANIQAHGIRLIDLTFYGVRDYHDRFAGRRGDFDYLLLILAQANALHLDVHISIPITGENAHQMEPLLDILDQYQYRALRIFIPHREGRGAALESIRLTQTELNTLSPRVQSLINTRRYKSEGQWLREENFQIPEQRMLGLPLTPENIDYFESISYENAIAFLEALDDDYYRAMPDLTALSRRYGDINSEKLFDQRDLYLYYQSQYTTERSLSLYNINDERHCFSRRF